MKPGFVVTVVPQSLKDGTLGFSSIHQIEAVHEWEWHSNDEEVK